MNVVSYQVVDARTGAVVAKCATRIGAQRSADKRDLAYGAVRYIVKPIYTTSMESTSCAQ